MLLTVGKNDKNDSNKNNHKNENKMKHSKINVLLPTEGAIKTGNHRRHINPKMSNKQINIPGSRQVPRAEPGASARKIESTRPSSIYPDLQEYTFELHRVTLKPIRIFMNLSEPDRAH